MRELFSGFKWHEDEEIQDLVVEDGIVVYRGQKQLGIEAEVVHDCSGRTLFPKWVDNHCHILPTGLDLLKLQLGQLTTRDEILDAVRDRNATLPLGEWLMAVHYDQTKFADSRHLTRQELDKISTTRPILLRHVSGHASIANSAALQAANVDESTPNPSGGEFSRDDSGNLNGLLLEDAHEAVTAASPNLTLDQMVDAILAASKKMSALGIGAAADMMTGRFNLDLELQAYRIAAEKGVNVRFRLYMQWSQVFGSRKIDSSRLLDLVKLMDPNSCKVAGIKIFADGAIGSGTAAIFGKYVGRENETDNQGQLIYAPDRLSKMVQIADEAGYQIAIHSIGNRSTDVVMDTYEALPGPSIHRIEHAMMLSDEQIERMARLNCFVSMQPEFLAQFGHAYLKQLGPERAGKLKRFRSVTDAGLRLSLSSDRPIVSGDPELGIRCAHKRPSGFDPIENVTPSEAIRGYTQAGADAMGDSDCFGSLLPGQFADCRWI